MGRKPAGVALQRCATTAERNNNSGGADGLSLMGGMTSVDVLMKASLLEVTPRSSLNRVQNRKKLFLYGQGVNCDNSNTLVSTNTIA